MFQVEKHSTTNHPLVSVIIPTFNRAHYLSHAIDSVLSQTYTNFEILVIDDGSEDNTVDLLNKYNSSGIIYKKQENRGNAAARNTGLQFAKGEFIAFLDSDDIWHQDKLLKQVAFMLSNPTLSLSFCLYQYINEKGSVYKISKNYNKENTFDELFNGNIIATLSLVVVKKSVLLSLDGFDENLKQSPDYDLYLRLSKKYKFGKLAQNLVSYRKHPQNISANLLGRRDAHLLIFKKSSIMGDKSYFEKWCRVSFVYLYIGYLLYKKNDYFHSLMNIIISLVRYPLVGLYPPKKGKKFEPMYESSQFKMPYIVIWHCLKNLI